MMNRRELLLNGLKALALAPIAGCAGRARSETAAAASEESDSRPDEWRNPERMTSFYALNSELYSLSNYLRMIQDDTEPATPLPEADLDRSMEIIGEMFSIYQFNCDLYREQSRGMADELVRHATRLLFANQHSDAGIDISYLRNLDLGILVGVASEARCWDGEIAYDEINADRPLLRIWYNLGESGPLEDAMIHRIQSSEESTIPCGNTAEDLRRSLRAYEQIYELAEEVGDLRSDRLRQKVWTGSIHSLSSYWGRELDRVDRSCYWENPTGLSISELREDASRDLRIDTAELGDLIGKTHRKHFPQCRQLL